MGQPLRITAFQGYMIMILSIGVMNHVQLLPVLLSAAVRDAWAGALLCVVPACALALLYAYAARKTRGIDIVSAVRGRYGNIAAAALGGITAAYALLSIVVTLKDTSYWAHTSYMPRTPIAAIAIVLTALCVCGAKAGLRAIAICAGILLPVVMLLGYFVMSANFQFKDYSRLFPLFTHGYMPAGSAALYTLSGITELVLLLFVQRQLSTAMRRRGILLVTLSLIGLTVGPLTGSIALFGPFESTELRYPAFEQWRMVVLSKFVTHLDAFSIFQWLSGTFIRLSFLMFLILDILSRRLGLKQRTVLVAMLLSIGLSFTLLPIDDLQLFRFMETVYFRIALAFGLTMLLVIAALGRFGLAYRKEGGAADG